MTSTLNGLRREKMKQRKNQIVVNFIFLYLSIFTNIAEAKTCDQYDFGSSSTAYYVYSSGRSWDFIANRSMLINSFEVKSVLATEKSGTFHMRIEINNVEIARWDQYVDTNIYQAYIHLNNILFNLKINDKITYHIWGSFYSSQYYSNLGTIKGPNYLGADTLISQDIK
jgi:hypothetical protein